MIHYLENTNLLDWFDVQTVPCGIAHSCNCLHIMGGGIAKQIAMRYPEAVAADKTTIRGDRSKLGTYSVAVFEGTPTKLVYNVYGQFDIGHGRRTSYDALTDALGNLRVDAMKRGLTRIGIPFNMGCKLGGGEWSIVHEIVKWAFPKELIDLYICRYEP